MSYNYNKENVLKRVREHYDWATQNYEVVGVFLQGSWNYSELMCDEESDVDTKCLVLPTFEDFCLNKKPVSYTHVFDNTEHCEVKDLRLYMNCFKKQNVNFVEVLFTDYFVLNPKYEKIFFQLVERREDIVHYNEKAAVNCMLGLAYQKQKALCHPYGGLKEKIAKYGYDGKQLSHCLRMYYMLNDYLANKPYEECLKMTDERAMELLALKRHQPAKKHSIFTTEEANLIIDNIVYKMKFIVDEEKNNLNDVNHELDYLFDKVVVDCMREYLKKVIYE